MEVERNCSVCQEEAPMFCRLCSTSYCPDHLCLHLNVAWETNTWTKRNSNDSEGTRESDIPKSNSRNDASLDINSINSTYLETKTDLPNPPKSILTYTEAQLQEQYNFYLSQARRIRTELERRAISLSGTSASGRDFHASFERHEPIRKKSNHKLPKSATYAYELLLGKLRSGHISVEQVAIGIAQMSALGAAKKQSRS